MTPKQILSASKSVLVIDWPSRDVPDALTSAGFAVVVRGGPGESEYSTYETNNDGVVLHRAGRPPEQVDLVYSYRPMDELPKIVAIARHLGAKAVWIQSGFASAGARDPKGCWMPEHESRQAHGLVKSVGLEFLTQPYIGDAAREFGPPRE
jgi:predicted CoA-binding protein